MVSPVLIESFRQPSFARKVTSMTKADLQTLDVFNITPHIRERFYSSVRCNPVGNSMAVLGYTSYGPEHGVQPGLFQDTAIVLHRRGQRVVHTKGNGQTIHRSAGDRAVSVFPAGWEVMPNYLEPCEGILVSFRPQALAPFGHGTTLPAMTGLMDNVLEGLLETLWQANGGSTRVAEAVGKAMLTHVVERYGTATPSTPAWFRRALAYINTHLGEAISVEELATATGFSRSHFTRQFKLHTGTSPLEFLQRCRIERAKELMLNEPDLCLADVAAEVGFYDQSHFTARFREQTGFTPAAYRARSCLDEPQT
jgi:AraC-like DNA-binding protein